MFRVLKWRYGFPMDLAPESSDQAKYSRRLAALLLDWFASWAVAGLIFQRALGLGQWILFIFFFEVAILTALGGQSAGQRVFGIKVTNWEPRGPISPVAAILRTFLLCLVIPPLITDGHGRGLHDRIARSCVIKV